MFHVVRLFLVLSLSAACAAHDEDEVCKPGFGSLYVRDVGSCGDSLITTEEECKREVFGRHQQNKHEYKGVRDLDTVMPPGCVRGNGDWFFNKNFKHKNNKHVCDSKSRDNFMNLGFKCICGQKCLPCPKNYYSEGGKNAECVRCPEFAPHTASNVDLFDSVKKCGKFSEATFCEPGFEYNPDPEPIRASGKCKNPIISSTDCIAVAKLFSSGKSPQDMNTGYSNHIEHTNSYPGGCYRCKRGADSRYCFNKNFLSEMACSEEHKCLCKPKAMCTKCPPNTYSAGGTGVRCTPCVAPSVVNEDQTICEDVNYRKIKNMVDGMKEKQEEVADQTSRLWQKEQVRLRYDKVVKANKGTDNQNEASACKKERKDGTVIFPAIQMTHEIEKGEDATCINVNRDELLKSFCAFTTRVDELFDELKFHTSKKAKSFWPNICCKERNGEAVEVCNDETGNVKREDIIPFAMSQGGTYNRQAVYGEVTKAIKPNGYIHEGMVKLIRSLATSNKNKKKKTLRDIDSFFQDEISLCGPRVIDDPVNGEGKLCQLFLPYEHAMKTFYSLVEHLSIKKMPAQKASLLQVVEKSLIQRQFSTRKIRAGKMNAVQGAIQGKAKAAYTPKAEQQCKKGTEWTSKKLAQKKNIFCKGYGHVDLASAGIKNIAIHYLKKDLPKTLNDYMINLKTSLRFRVEDESCPGAPLFRASDISLQRISMDAATKTEKEWVAVVSLNSQDKNGYLQSELPFCRAKDYLISAKVVVKAFVDNENCCNDVVDYETCVKNNACESIVPLKNSIGKQYTKYVELFGTKYSVVHADARHRRRGLLQGAAGKRS